MHVFTQKISSPNPKTFVGTGKLEDIAAYVKTHDIQMVILDDELSPSQLRNVEKVLNTKILR